MATSGSLIRSLVRHALSGPWPVVIAVWLLLAIAASLLAGEIARRQTEADLARQAKAAVALHAAVLRSELEKHRSLPFVLAQDPQAMALLAGDGNPGGMNRKLELLAHQTRAAAIYLLDDQGVARSASNWRLPTSFVGSDYSFRPYFTRTMAEGSAEFFALGTVSGRPGLYLAQRISGSDGRPLGVAVVKVEFDALEEEWRSSGEPAYVTDPSGVVLITSVPAWRFRTVAPMTADQRKRVLAGQTLGHDALGPLPFTAPAGPSRRVTAAIDGSPQQWISASTATSTPGWVLHLLSPAGNAVLVAVTNARAVAALIVTLLTAGVALVVRRRQLARAHAVAEEAARAELERRIEDRTVELRHANADLSREIVERRQAEASRELLREELVQANKLATLGQIAAGVAHEINQPVAAIRTHADSASAYLDRENTPGVRRNLMRIADLTGRIGSITDELRAFARKTASTPSPVDPEAAIDGALVLLSGRLRESRITLNRTATAGPSLALAERVRLEQVIVNLIQNAIEALEETRPAAPRLSIDVRSDRDHVEIVIADNGPGLHPAVAQALFTPFVTTKPNGLGLGLVICRDIVAGFGGELILRPSESGATFVISLKASH